MTAKVAAHRLRALAEAVERGDITQRVLFDPQLGLTPEFIILLERALIAGARNVETEIEGPLHGPL